MDSTAEAKEYIRRIGLPRLMNDVVETVLRERPEPDDVLQTLLQYYMGKNGKTEEQNVPNSVEVESEIGDLKALVEKAHKKIRHWNPEHPENDVKDLQKMLYDKFGMMEAERKDSKLFEMDDSGFAVGGFGGDGWADVAQDEGNAEAKDDAKDDAKETAMHEFKISEDVNKFPSMLVWDFRKGKPEEGQMYSFGRVPHYIVAGDHKCLSFSPGDCCLEFPNLPARASVARTISMRLQVPDLDSIGDCVELLRLFVVQQKEEDMEDAWVYVELWSDGKISLGYRTDEDPHPQPTKSENPLIVSGEWVTITIARTQSGVRIAAGDAGYVELRDKHVDLMKVIADLEREENPNQKVKTKLEMLKATESDFYLGAYFRDYNVVVDVSNPESQTDDGSEDEENPTLPKIQYRGDILLAWVATSRRPFDVDFHLDPEMESPLLSENSDMAQAFKDEVARIEAEVDKQFKADADIKVEGPEPTMPGIPQPYLNAQILPEGTLKLIRNTHDVSAYRITCMAYCMIHDVIACGSSDGLIRLFRLSDATRDATSDASMYATCIGILQQKIKGKVEYETDSMALQISKNLLISVTPNAVQVWRFDETVPGSVTVTAVHTKNSGQLSKSDAESDEGPKTFTRTFYRADGTRNGRPFYYEDTHQATIAEWNPIRQTWYFTCNSLTENDQPLHFEYASDVDDVHLLDLSKQPRFLHKDKQKERWTDKEGLYWDQQPINNGRIQTSITFEKPALVGLWAERSMPGADLIEGVGKQAMRFISAVPNPNVSSFCVAKCMNVSQFHQEYTDTAKYIPVPKEENEENGNAGPKDVDDYDSEASHEETATFCASISMALPALDSAEDLSIRIVWNRQSDYNFTEFEMSIKLVAPGGKECELWHGVDAKKSTLVDSDEHNESARLFLDITLVNDLVPTQPLKPPDEKRQGVRLQIEDIDGFKSILSANHEAGDWMIKFSVICPEALTEALTSGAKFDLAIRRLELDFVFPPAKATKSQVDILDFHGKPMATQNLDLAISSVSWSPDGKFILLVTHEESAHLKVLDGMSGAFLRDAACSGIPRSIHVTGKTAVMNRNNHCDVYQHIDDTEAVGFNSQLQLATVCWHPSGSMLAVVGNHDDDMLSASKTLGALERDPNLIVKEEEPGWKPAKEGSFYMKTEKRLAIYMDNLLDMRDQHGDNVPLSTVMGCPEFQSIKDIRVCLQIPSNRMYRMDVMLEAPDGTKILLAYNGLPKGDHAFASNGQQRSKAPHASFKRQVWYPHARDGFLPLLNRPIVAGIWKLTFGKMKQMADQMSSEWESEEEYQEEEPAWAYEGHDEEVGEGERAILIRPCPFSLEIWENENDGRVGEIRKLGGVEVYTPTGSLASCLLTNGRLRSICWVGEQRILLLTEDGTLSTAMLHYEHLWASIEDTIVYTHVKKDNSQTSLVFWNYESGTSKSISIDLDGSPVALAKCGDHCAVLLAEPNGESTLTLKVFTTLGQEVASQAIKCPCPQRKTLSHSLLLAGTTGMVALAQGTKMILWNWAKGILQGLTFDCDGSLKECKAVSSGGVPELVSDFGSEGHHSVASLFLSPTTMWVGNEHGHIQMLTMEEQELKSSGMVTTEGIPRVIQADKAGHEVAVINRDHILHHYKVKQDGNHWGTKTALRLEGQHNAVWSRHSALITQSAANVSIFSPGEMHHIQTIDYLAVHHSDDDKILSVPMNKLIACETPTLDTTPITRISLSEAQHEEENQEEVDVMDLQGVLGSRPKWTWKTLGIVIRSGILGLSKAIVEARREKEEEEKELLKNQKQKEKEAKKKEQEALAEKEQEAKKKVQVQEEENNADDGVNDFNLFGFGFLDGVGGLKEKSQQEVIKQFEKVFKQNPIVITKKDTHQIKMCKVSAYILSEIENRKSKERDFAKFKKGPNIGLQQMPPWLIGECQAAMVWYLKTEEDLSRLQLINNEGVHTHEGISPTSEAMLVSRNCYIRLPTLLNTSGESLGTAGAFEVKRLKKTQASSTDISIPVLVNIYTITMLVRFIDIGEEGDFFSLYQTSWPSKSRNDALLMRIVENKEKREHSIVITTLGGSFRAVSVPSQEWTRITIELQGTFLRVWINGIHVTELNRMEFSSHGSWSLDPRGVLLFASSRGVHPDLDLKSAAVYNSDIFQYFLSQWKETKDQPNRPSGKKNWLYESDEDLYIDGDEYVSDGDDYGRSPPPPIKKGKKEPSVTQIEQWQNFFPLAQAIVETPCHTPGDATDCILELWSWLQTSSHWIGTVTQGEREGMKTALLTFYFMMREQLMANQVRDIRMGDHQEALLKVRERIKNLRRGAFTYYPGLFGPESVSNIIVQRTSDTHGNLLMFMPLVGFFISILPSQVQYPGRVYYKPCILLKDIPLEKLMKFANMESLVNRVKEGDDNGDPTKFISGFLSALAERPYAEILAQTAADDCIQWRKSQISLTNERWDNEGENMDEATMQYYYMYHMVCYFMRKFGIPEHKTRLLKLTKQMNLMRQLKHELQTTYFESPDPQEVTNAKKLLMKRVYKLANLGALGPSQVEMAIKLCETITALMPPVESEPFPVLSLVGAQELSPSLAKHAMLGHFATEVERTKQGVKSTKRQVEDADALGIKHTARIMGIYEKLMTQITWESMMEALSETEVFCNKLFSCYWRFSSHMIWHLLVHLFTEVLPIPISRKQDNGQKSFADPRSSIWVSKQDIPDYQQQLETVLILQRLAVYFIHVCLHLDCTDQLCVSICKVTSASMLACTDALLRMQCKAGSEVNPFSRTLFVGGTTAYGISIESFAESTQWVEMPNQEMNIARSMIVDYFQSLELEPSRHLFTDTARNTTPTFENQLATERSLSSLSSNYGFFLRQYPEYEAYKIVAHSFFYANSWVDSAKEITSDCAFFSDANVLAPTDSFLAEIVFTYLKAQREHQQNKSLLVPSNYIAEANWPDNPSGNKNASTNKKSGEDSQPPCPTKSEPRTEDDILHVHVLPDFDGALSNVDSQLLLSYLTVPYLRIPLVMSFFGESSRVHALHNPDLRTLLELVVFEPGAFQPHQKHQHVEFIPIKDPSALATPHGLLLNELDKCPRGVMEPLRDLLDNAFAMGKLGNLDDAAKSFILFVIRLALKLLSAARRLQYIFKSGRQFRELDGRHLAALTDILPSICKRLGEIYHLIVQWTDTSTSESHSEPSTIAKECNVRAHQLILIRELTEVLSPDIITKHATANIFFLAVQYMWSGSLEIPDMDLFAAFIELRPRILNKLEILSNSDNLDETMQYVFEIVSRKKDQPQMTWRLGRRSGGGEPNGMIEAVGKKATNAGAEDTGIAFDLAMFHVLIEEGHLEALSFKLTSRPEILSIWDAVDVSAFRQKAVRKKGSSHPPPDRAQEGDLVLLLGDCRVPCRVLDITRNREGELTMKVHQFSTGDTDIDDVSVLRQLNSDWVNPNWEATDYISSEPQSLLNHLEDPSTGMDSHCTCDICRGIVEEIPQLRDRLVIASKTRWIIGTAGGLDSQTHAAFLQGVLAEKTTSMRRYQIPAHDSAVEWWQCDPGPVNYHVSASRLCVPSNLRETEQWIIPLLKEKMDWYFRNVDEKGQIGSHLVLYMQEQVLKEDDDVAYLTLQACEEAQEQGQLHGHNTKFELFLYKAINDLFIFKIERHGQIWHRKLVAFDESHRISIQSAAGIPKSKLTWIYVPHSQEGLVGEDKVDSVIVYRNLQQPSKKGPLQRSVLPAQLIGAVPAALLPDWKYWHDVDDPYHLVGESTKPHPSYQVHIDLDRDSGETIDSRKRASTRAKISMKPLPHLTDLPTLILLNPLSAPPGSCISSLLSVFQMVERFGQILVWGTMVDGNLHLHSVELPKLQLTFLAKQKYGEVRLYSKEHSNYYISHGDLNTLDCVAMLDHIRYKLLLETDQHEHAILVPNYEPSEPEDSVKDMKFDTKMSDTNYFLYPLHVSEQFVITYDMSSALYLACTYYKARKWAKCFDILGRIGTDDPPTEEQRDMIGIMAPEDSDRDNDGDDDDAEMVYCKSAIGCKLKLCYYGTNPLEWEDDEWEEDDTPPSLEDILTRLRYLCMHIQFQTHAPLACRLTAAEELQFIKGLIVPCCKAVNEAATKFLMDEGHDNPTESLLLIPTFEQLLTHFDLLEQLYACLHKGDAEAYESLFVECQSLAYTPAMLPSLSYLVNRYSFCLSIMNAEDKASIPKTFWYTHRPTISTSGCMDASVLQNKQLEAMVYAKLRGDQENGIATQQVLVMSKILMFVTGQVTSEILTQMDEEEPQWARLVYILKQTRPNFDALAEWRAAADNLILEIACAPDMFTMMPLYAYMSHLCTLLAHNYNVAMRITWMRKDPKTVFTNVLQGLRDAMNVGTLRVPVDRTDYKMYKRMLYPMRMQMAPAATTAGARLHFNVDAPTRIKSMKAPCTSRTFASPKSHIILQGMQVMQEEIDVLATKPLKPLGLDNFVEERQRVQVNPKLPFDLSRHPTVQHKGAKSLLKHFENDVEDYAQMQANKSAGLKLKSLEMPVLEDIQARLVTIRTADSEFIEKATKVLIGTVNRDEDKPKEFQDVMFQAMLRGGLRGHVEFTTLATSLLYTSGDILWRSLGNCHLEGDGVVAAQSLLVMAMLKSCRLAQCNLALRQLYSLMILIKDKGPMDAAVLINSNLLATFLSMERAYMNPNGKGGYNYDPRFLIFEWLRALTLRKRQVELVEQLVAAVKDKKPNGIIKQMIMGAGKTTVICPLVFMMLDDGDTLALFVVPSALVDFSRDQIAVVINILHRHVWTLDFDRSTQMTLEWYNQVERAARNSVVIVSSPFALKSMILRFIGDLLAFKKQAKVGGTMQSLQYWVPVFRLLHERTVAVMDEVDDILHPLRSELNFPIGNQQPLHFNPHRWSLPMHLLGLFHRIHLGGHVANHESSIVRQCISQCQKVLEDGYRSKQLQKLPHLVLLDMQYYTDAIKPVLAKWAVIWLRTRQLLALSDNDMCEYMTTKVDADGVIGKKVANLHAKHRMMLNLSHDWLQTILPHVLQKRYRISFGLMTDVDFGDQGQAGKNPGRLKLAIPFQGKDMPSSNSEYSHPDVLIGSTIVAYQQEGLRYYGDPRFEQVSDFDQILNYFLERFANEKGPPNQRYSSVTFAEWIHDAGGRTSSVDDIDSDAKDPNVIVVPGLAYLKQATVEQKKDIYKLLRYSTQAIELHLDHFIFPKYIKHYTQKISASGFDLGIDVFVSRRIGMSGTVNDIIPSELTTANTDGIYEKGSQGEILTTLMDCDVMSVIEIPLEWDAEFLLKLVAKNGKYSALIDVGAVITGFDNLGVAKYLLNILPEDLFDGVVFLDHHKKMILDRRRKEPMHLSQSGISIKRRFSFFDQVHTTGIDLPQDVNAKAALTLGKDMTFRDYSQGAFRMRQIGNGQTIDLLLTPEIHQKIKTDLEAGSVPLEISNTPMGTVAWLVLSQMRSEKTQHTALHLQEIASVWKRIAFGQILNILQDCDFTTSEGLAGVEKQGRALADLAMNFVESIHYDVTDKVAPTIDLVETVTVRVKDHPIVTAQMDHPVIAKVVDILGNNNTEDGDTSEEEDGEKKKKQTKADENLEQEQQQEQQQQVQMMVEESIDLSPLDSGNCSRYSEEPEPWPVGKLGDCMYDFNDFKLFRRQPLKVPKQFLYVSDNFYRKTWTGRRKVKNVVMTIEWCDQEERIEDLEWSYASKEIEEQSQTLAKRIFEFFDRDHVGKISVRQLELVIEMGFNQCPKEDAAEWRQILQNALRGKPIPDDPHECIVTFKDFLYVLTGPPFREMQSGRKTSILSLSEAESFRRLMHLNDSAVQYPVALRCLPRGHGVLDTVKGFQKGYEYHDKAIHLMLRLFNNELDYDENSMSTILSLIQGNTPANRQAFFQSLAACRRTLTGQENLFQEDKSSGSLLTTFMYPTVYHKMYARALAFAMRDVLEGNALAVRDAFEKFDLDGNNMLGLSEVLAALKALKLNPTMEEVIVFMTAIDTDGDMQISWSEFVDVIQAQISDKPNTHKAITLEPQVDGEVEDIEEALHQAHEDFLSRKRAALADAEMAIAQEEDERDLIMVIEEDEKNVGNPKHEDWGLVYNFATGLPSLPRGVAPLGAQPQFEEDRTDVPEKAGIQVFNLRLRASGVGLSTDVLNQYGVTLHFRPPGSLKHSEDGLSLFRTTKKHDFDNEDEIVLWANGTIGLLSEGNPKKQPEDPDLNVKVQDIEEEGVPSPKAKSSPKAKKRRYDSDDSDWDSDYPDSDAMSGSNDSSSDGPPKKPAKKEAWAEKENLLYDGIQDCKIIPEMLEGFDQVVTVMVDCLEGKLQVYWYGNLVTTLVNHPSLVKDGPLSLDKLIGLALFCGNSKTPKNMKGASLRKLMILSSIPNEEAVIRSTHGIRDLWKCTNCASYQPYGRSTCFCGTSRMDQEPPPNDISVLDYEYDSDSDKAGSDSGSSSSSDDGGSGAGKDSDSGDSEKEEENDDSDGDEDSGPKDGGSDNERDGDQDSDDGSEDGASPDDDDAKSGSDSESESKPKTKTRKDKPLSPGVLCITKKSFEGLVAKRLETPFLVANLASWCSESRNVEKLVHTLAMFMQDTPVRVGTLYIDKNEKPAKCYDSYYQPVPNILLFPVEPQWKKLQTQGYPPATRGAKFVVKDIQLEKGAFSTHGKRPKSAGFRPLSSIRSRPKGPDSRLMMFGGELIQGTNTGIASDKWHAIDLPGEDWDANPCEWQEVSPAKGVAIGTMDYALVSAQCPNPLWVVIGGADQRRKDFASIYYNGIQVWEATSKENIVVKTVKPGTADTIMSPRAGLSAVWSGSEILVFGGHDMTDTFDEVWSVTLADTGATADSQYETTWELLKPVKDDDTPPARSGHVACFYDGAMWIFGGMCRRDGYMADMWRYKYSEDKKWEQITFDNAISVRTNAASVVHNDEWWIHGGENEDGLVDGYLYAFSFKEKTLTRMIAREGPRWSGHACALSKDMFVLAVNGEVDAEIVQEVQYIDIRASKKKPLPAKVSSTLPSILEFLHTEVGASIEKGLGKYFKKYKSKVGLDKLWKIMTNAMKERKPQYLDQLAALVLMDLESWESGGQHNPISLDSDSDDDTAAKDGDGDNEGDDEDDPEIQAWFANAEATLEKALPDVPADYLVEAICNKPLIIDMDDAMNYSSEDPIELVQGKDTADMDMDLGKKLGLVALDENESAVLRNDSNVDKEYHCDLIESVAEPWSSVKVKATWEKVAKAIGSVATRNLLIGGLRTIRNMMKNGLPVNAECGGITMVHIACICNNFHMLELLYVHGADLNQKSHNAKSGFPTDFAAKYGALKCLKFLVQKGATYATALHSAAEVGFHSTARYLLKVGVPIELKNRGITPLVTAMLHERCEFAQMLMSLGARYDYYVPKGVADLPPGSNLLHLAAKMGLDKVCKDLLKKDESLNTKLAADGSLPLHVASVSVSPILNKDYLTVYHLVMKMILDPTCDVQGFNELEKYPEGAFAQDAQGWSPLMIAALSNNTMAVDVLIKAFGTYYERKAQNAGNELTPAELKDKIRLAIQTKNNHGLSSLMWAAWVDSKPIIEKLLRCGAILSPADKRGLNNLKACRQKAEDEHDDETLSLLRVSLAAINPPKERTFEQVEVEAQHGSIQGRLEDGADEIPGNREMVTIPRQDITLEEWILGKKIEASEFDDDVLKMVAASKLFVQNRIAKGDTMCPAYIFALHLYTLESNMYRDLNRALRDEDLTAINDWSVLIHYLQDALNQIRPTSSVVYRGITLPRKIYANILKHYKPGKQIMWAAFSSTSALRSVGSMFVRNGDDENYRGILFRIKAFSTRSISSCSFFPSEAELLFRPCSRFRVVSMAVASDFNIGSDDLQTNEVETVSYEQALAANDPILVELEEMPYLYE